MTRVVPILMYHEITPRPRAEFRKYSVTPDELDRQLAWLAHAGYVAVDMDAVRDAWLGVRTLPARTVAITFDDGLRDCVEHSVPLLQARGFTATYFVVADLVGATSRWLIAERGFELPMADWSVLRAAESAGMRCESHTSSHPRLATLTAAACRTELVRSREILEDGLERRVVHLAYPFGSFSADTHVIAAEAGYETACTVRESVATPDDDLLMLPRIPVVGGEGMRDFVSRLRTAHRAGEPLRTTAERVARRLGFMRPTRHPRS
jgi:peptidoglycan/xylan/chitin deacetylase (PgdA/CDA1 family)